MSTKREKKTERQTEEEMKEKQRKNRKVKLVPSIALSMFAGIGLALLLVVHGLLEENIAAVSKYLSSGWIFPVITGVWVFLGVFASTRLVGMQSRSRVIAEVLSANSFLAVLVCGLSCMYTVTPSISWWWWLITIITLGGLSGVFHGWFLYFQRTRLLISLKLKKMKDIDTFVKSLELEHDFFRAYFQQFVSSVALFLVAGVVAYYLASEDVKATSIISACIIVAWFIAGLFYGIFIPIQNHLEYIRREIMEIALGRRKKEKQGNGH
ncbi:MAG: hypothetical protein JSV12_01870 [Candidatus Bathyarchaeota archaeon]|nr:MAG: hypothetical protein JSV12_01870 [Candidatus Bathyarchaeota archaeon]